MATLPNEPQEASGFELDLRGRLRNLRLPAGRAAVPLFEAVVNAIHAVEAGTGKSGNVEVKVVREAAQQELGLSDGPKLPITGFQVSDDGIGFTDENYRSFRTSDSRFKSSLGGRGVGRFTWLKAFEEVRVSSVFRADAGLYRRSFVFSENGISDIKTEPALGILKTGTVVELLRLRPEYEPQFPKRLDTIAQRTVEHCFAATIACAKKLSVSVFDDPDRADLSAMVKDVLKNAQKDSFEIGKAKFTVTHLRVTSAEVKAHRIAFLANRREVIVENLSSSIPQLRSRLTEKGAEFWWLALVESEVLDNNVTSERDGFLLSEQAPTQADSLLQGVPTFGAIKTKAVESVRLRAEPFTAPLKEKSYERFETYVQTKGPEYRHLASLRRDAIEAIPADLPDEKLDLELHKITFEVEQKLRETGQAIQQATATDVATYEKYLSEENLVGKSNLAKYVVHRRNILDLFRRALENDASGKRAKEEAVHRLVFPLKKTSDEVPYEQLNMWIIDERLAYHSHCASDKELRANPVVTVEDNKRPDLLIFGRPFAFVDGQPPFGSVVIVEFKRPERDDYTDEENPITQVYDYVERVRAGKTYDLKGRELRVPTHVHFYCYVICDITATLRKQAAFMNLDQTPDEMGFYGFNKALRTYVEVISFDKLLNDSEKRNRILFEKLNLPKK